MKRLATRSLSALVITAVAYLFFKALSNNWENVRQISAAPNMLTLMGVMLLILSVVSTGVLWGQLLSRLANKRISYKASIKTHLASWLLKYIPGQAGSYLGKISWGMKNGLSKLQITSSFIYENIFLIIASTIPTLPVVIWLFSEEAAGKSSLFIPLLIVLPLLLTLHPGIFFHLTNKAAKLLKKPPIDTGMFLNGRELWSFQLKFILPRILNGLGFVCIAASFFSVSASMIFPLASIYVLAGIIGVLAVFVPSGLGVREGIVALFASAYFPAEEAVALSLLARFYATLADVGIFGLYIYLNKGKVNLA